MDNNTSTTAARREIETCFISNIARLLIARNILTMGKIFQIFVVGIKGERKTVDVANSQEDFNKTTVLGFKRKLAEKLPGQAGDDFSSLRLLFTDQQLEDHDTFEEHQIEDGSTFFLVLRLPGGTVGIKLNDELV